MKKYDDIKDIIDENLNQEHLKLYLYWIIERYSVYLKRFKYKEEPPWSQDQVFQKYSFVNVRRIVDRVTIFTLDKIINNDSLSLGQKVLNLLVFRVFNSPQSYDLLNFPVKQVDIKLDFPQFIKKHTRKVQEGQRLYRPAYMHSGAVKSYHDQTKDIPTFHRPFYTIWEFYHSGNLRSLIGLYQKGDAKGVFDYIITIPGMGPFLSYQVYVDLTYIEGSLLTQNDFVYLGGGAHRGVQIVCPNIHWKKRWMFIHYVQQNIEYWFKKYYNTSLHEIMSDLPEQQRYLSLSNIQNCFCEFSKYFKLKFNPDKTKKRYFRPHIPQEQQQKSN